MGESWGRRAGGEGGPRAAVDMLDEEREEPGCLTPQACLTHWAGNGLSIHGGRIILRLSSTKYRHMHAEGLWRPLTAHETKKKKKKGFLAGSQASRAPFFFES